MPRPIAKTSWHHCDGSLMVYADEADRQAMALNRAAYDYYAQTLTEIATTCFRWDGLPDGVDSEILEYWLLRDGQCALVYDEAFMEDPLMRAPDGYAVMQCTATSMPDNYMLPTRIMGYSAVGVNKSFSLRDDNAVLFLNTRLRYDMWRHIDWFAWRLADIDRAIDMNVQNQKTPKILAGSDEQQLTLVNMAKKLALNVYYVFTKSKFDLSNIKTLDLSDTFKGVDMQVLKHQIWNEAMSFLGVPNVNEDKRERMVTDEIAFNQGDRVVRLDVRMRMRRRAIEDCARVFGIRPSCEFVGTFRDMPDDPAKEEGAYVV